jgi:hypothetical protein
MRIISPQRRLLTCLFFDDGPERQLSYWLLTILLTISYWQLPGAAGQSAVSRGAASLRGDEEVSTHFYDHRLKEHLQ